MNYGKWREALQHPAAQAISLIGFTTCFLLGAGPERAFVQATQILFAISLILGSARSSLANTGVKLSVACIVIILLINAAMPGDQTNHRLAENLLRFGFLAASTFFVLSSLSAVSKARLSMLLPTLAAAVVAIHFLAITVGPGMLNIEVARLGGLLGNPHLLALTCLLMLPALFFIAATTHSRALRMLMFLALALEFYILLETGSRPAWLALCAATLAASLLTTSNRARTVTMLATGSALVLLYVSDVSIFRDRIHEFWLNLADEERFSIWSDSWSILLDGSAAQWLFGRGIGSFEHFYAGYTHGEALLLFVFPHNFILEILSDNGIFGLTLISLGYLLYYRVFVILQRHSHETAERILVACLLAASLGHLLHTFMVLPFYSKYHLYPQAIMLGFLLRLYDAPGRHQAPTGS